MNKPVCDTEIFGVIDGKETSLGNIPTPPKMKARELTNEMFGRFEIEDGSDADLCYCVAEQVIDHMIATGWKWNPLIEKV